VTDFWIPWVLERLGGLPGDGGKARREKYRAPEQVSEGMCGPEADQYSLAALLQACLTKSRARVLPDIARAIERALSPKPEARFPSVSEFAAALGVSARPASIGTLPQFLEDDDEDDRDEYDPSYAPRPSRWRWIPVGVVTLVVLGAVAAPWLLSSGSRRALQRAPDEEYLKAAVDSVPFADTAAVPLNTVVPPPRAPAERTPVSPVAPVRRPSVAPPRRARPVPERSDVTAPAVGGRLFINSTPWGQVYVDSELIGNTPRVDVPVSPGAHRLRVLRDGFLPYDTTVRIAPRQELRVTDIVLQEIKP
jgi:hypothetical protein